MSAIAAPEKLFSYLEVEAALCVWEHIDNVTMLNQPTTCARWTDYRSNSGSAQLRHESIELGQYVLKVFDLIPEDFRDGHSYDWDIVPAILETLEWETYQTGGTRAGPTYGQRYTIPTDIEKAASRAIDELVFQTYLNDANDALRSRYGIDFITGAGMTVADFRASYFDAKDARLGAAALADWYAEKYDLTPKE